MLETSHDVEDKNTIFDLMKKKDWIKLSNSTKWKIREDIQSTYDRDVCIYMNEISNSILIY